MTREKTTAEILEIFDVNRQTVARWVKQGCPCEKRGGGLSNLFDENEVAAWLKSKGLSGAPGRPAGPTGDELQKAKLRKELAMADLHEIRAGRERGTLVDRAEQERFNVAKFSAIKSKLMSLPAAVSPVLVGLKAIEIENELESRIRETLTELSRKRIEKCDEQTNKQTSPQPQVPPRKKKKPVVKSPKAKPLKRSKSN